MRIVHLCTSDDGSGAFVAARRLMEAQRGAHLDASLLVGHRRTHTPHVVQAQPGLWGRAAQQARKAWQVAQLMGRLSTPSRKALFAFAPATVGTDVSRLPLVRRADVLHLHWTQHGFLALSHLYALAALGKPVVWSQHDLWALTGGCLYPGSCSHWQQHCGHCPLLKHPATHDRSAQLWQQKRELYRALQPTLVAVSNWLAQRIQSAPLTRHLRVEVIPNPIDTDVFVPMPPQEARARLGLPLDARILLFVARGLHDPRKGLAQLLEALALLEPDPRRCLVAVGEGSLPQHPNVRSIGMGAVSDTTHLAWLFAAADVLALPSLEDNLPTTAMEAMACGTPVVGYRTGGIPEMVDDGQTGLLAPTGDRRALAHALRELLYNHALCARMGQSARAAAVARYSEAAVATRTRALYTELLGRAT